MRAMTDSQRTVAIVYGWAEGPWHATRLVRKLEARGFTVTRDVAATDVIFAHSSGCYRVPEGVKAQCILLVGVPYGSIPSLAFGVIRKVTEEYAYHRRNRQLGWWCRKLLYNGWYLVTRPRAMYDLLTKRRLGNLPDTHGRRVLLVRPATDVFMPQDIHTVPAGREYEYREIEGSHDGCWVEPKPYVDLIQNIK